MRPGLSSLPTIAAAALLAGALLAACGRYPGSGTPVSGTPGADPIRVVTTTTVFADLVRQSGGAAVTVDSLVPRNADPHTFEPKPSDVRRVAEADLVVMNGFGLDDWMRPMLVEARKVGAGVVVLAEDLPGVTYLRGSEDQAGTTTDGTGGVGAAFNPHLWLDATLASRYVERIATALKAVRPELAAGIDASAAAYQARLTTLDQEIRARLAAIPADRRRIVSYHDAFPYYALAYGLEVVGVAVAAPGQEPSAGEIAALVDAIRAAHVSAILSEAQFSPKLVEQLAQETGVSVVHDLYTDALGDPPADTYEGLLRLDTDRIVAAIGGGG